MMTDLHLTALCTKYLQLKKLTLLRKLKVIRVGNVQTETTFSKITLQSGLHRGNTLTWEILWE